MRDKGTKFGEAKRSEAIGPTPRVVLADPGWFWHGGPIPGDPLPSGPGGVPAADECTSQTLAIRSSKKALNKDERFVMLLNR